MFGRVGLGTFPLAGPFSHVTPDGAREILDAYFDAGGKYLDTSPTYALGEVETLLGHYLSGRPRNSFAISTSCGYVRDGDEYKVSGRRQDVLRDAEESLKRLKLDHFDVYISHIPDPDTPLEETASALQELKDDGVAAQIGVSNVTAEQLRRYGSAAEISVVQNRLSFANRSISKELQAALEEVGAKLVAYQVIERGLLTGSPSTPRRDADLRNRKPEFAEWRVRWLDEHIVEPLKAYASQKRTTVPSLAVSWVLAQPMVALAQLGATNRDQAKLIPGLGQDLDAESIQTLEQIYHNATQALPGPAPTSIDAFLGIADYDVRSGSASGR